MVSNSAMFHARHKRECQGRERDNAISSYSVFQVPLFSTAHFVGPPHAKNMHGTENDTKNPFDLALLPLKNLSEFIR